MCPELPFALHCVSATVEGRVAVTVKFTVFIGAFTELRKVTTSFITSVIQSARMKQLDSHWTDFREIRYVKIF